MPEKILVDCAPGHDDALALVLAAGSPDVEVVAVTTVAGNQTLPKVTHNARAIASVIGLHDVPIAAGADRPLLRALRVADDVHGQSGLDGPVLPERIAPLDPRHAVDVIIETVLDRPPGTVTLVPTGPLTNIALAIRREPRLVERVKRVVFMGGGVHVGNVSAVAEFNVAVDPEAAQVVLGAGWDVTMVGLDVTHRALATPAVREAVTAVGTTPARFVLDLLDFFTEAYRSAQGFDHPPVHDPCAVAHVIDPGVVGAVRLPLAVELAGTLTTGMTVADRRGPVPADCPTSAALDIDPDRFWRLVVDALDRLGEPSGAVSAART